MNINDIAIGDTVIYRNGQLGVVIDITEKHIDGLNHDYKLGVLWQARIWTNTDSGGTYNSHRVDGVSHFSAETDIIAVVKEASE